MEVNINVLMSLYTQFCRKIELLYWDFHIYDWFQENYLLKQATFSSNKVSNGRPSVELYVRAAEETVLTYCPMQCKA